MWLAPGSLAGKDRNFCDCPHPGTAAEACGATCPAYHVPHVVGQPVDDRITATHKLQVFGLGGFFGHQEYHKAGWDEGHGHNDEDGDHHICALQAGWGIRRAGTPSPSVAWGKGHPPWCGIVTVRRAGHGTGTPTIAATLSLPIVQPVKQKPWPSPAITSKKPSTSHETATLPQTLYLDLQVIQGQAGTRFVHGVIGDCDACNNDQEETWKHENWLGMQTLVPSPPGPDSKQDGLPARSSSGAGLSGATQHLKAKPSLTGKHPWTCHKIRHFQVALWDIPAQV